MQTFRDDLLAGKVAFVAGGTSGINLGIAKRYAQLGAKVA
ncbi:MAG: short-chain dehydrogenase, partial [Chakrabartia sp.]